MINISLVLDNLSENINVSVSTESGNTITSVKVWDSTTYKVENDAIDLSSLLSGTDHNESFQINGNTHLNIENGKLLNIYYIEFTDSLEDKAVGVVSNFLLFYECILNKLLKTEVKGCKLINTKCSDKLDELYYSNSLLSIVQESLKFGFYEEANKTYKRLEDLCEICYPCGEYGDTIINSVLGISTENNNIVTYSS